MNIEPNRMSMGIIDYGFLLLIFLCFLINFINDFYDSGVYIYALIFKLSVFIGFVVYGIVEYGIRYLFHAYTSVIIFVAVIVFLRELIPVLYFIFELLYPVFMILAWVFMQLSYVIAFVIILFAAIIIFIAMMAPVAAPIPIPMPFPF